MSNNTHDDSYWGRLAQRRRSRRQLLGGMAAIAAAAGAASLACRSSTSSSTPKAAASPAGGASAAFSGPPAKITISVGAQDPSYIVPYIAREAGIFQRNGLDVNIQVIAGPTAIPALISGQIQLAHAGGGEVLAADVGGGDLVIIAAPSPAFPGYIYSAPNVKTAADVKGKKAAITSPGGTYDIILRASLQKMGVDAEKDVTFIATGSIPNALAALLNGAVSLSPAGVGPNSIKLEAAGMNRLFDPVDVPIDSAGVNVNRSWMTSNRPVAQRYIDSLVQGTVKFKQDKAFAVDIMKRFLEITDEQVATVSYNYYTQDKATPTLPYPKPELLAIQQVEITKKNAAAKNFDVSKIVDPSFVQNAADRKLDKA